MLVNNMHEGMGGKDGGKRSGDSGGNDKLLAALLFLWDFKAQAFRLLTNVSCLHKNIKFAQIPTKKAMNAQQYVWQH